VFHECSTEFLWFGFIFIARYLLLFGDGRRGGRAPLKWGLSIFVLSAIDGDRCADGRDIAKPQAAVVGGVLVLW